MQHIVHLSVCSYCGEYSFREFASPMYEAGQRMAETVNAGCAVKSTSDICELSAETVVLFVSVRVAVFSPPVSALVHPVRKKLKATISNTVLFITMPPCI